MSNPGQSGHSSIVAQTMSAELAGTGVTGTRPGSPLQFNEVYREYFGFVWRTARRMGVPDNALDDVCQEVFVVVYQRLRVFEGRSSVRTWIFGILTNVARSHRRSLERKSPAHRSKGQVLDPDALVDQAKSPFDRARTSEAREVAQTVLGQLDEDKRIVFVLAELEEMPIVEIADCLQVNVHTVRARLSAARKQFAQLVRRFHLRDARRAP